MAPTYTFAGDTPAILTGLIQGVNCHHVAAPGNPEVPEGSTVVASPGDTIDTGELEYDAHFLQEEGASPATPVKAPVVAAPAPVEAPAPTVEPAPAPAETVTAAPATPAPTF